MSAGTSTASFPLLERRSTAVEAASSPSGGRYAPEEALRHAIFAELPRDELAEALGLVATAFGAAKDVLGREWVARATRAHAPSLDLRALFAGTDGA